MSRGRGAPAKSGARRPQGEAPAAPGLAQRRGALTLLVEALDQRRMMDEAALGEMAGPERAAAHSLADLTLRRLGEIDRALSAFVAEPPPVPGLHILRIMAAEILFAGSAAHAAVDSAVRLARSSPRTVRLAGLVNAVGRRLSALPTLCAAPDAGRINAASWLAEALDRDWGAETADAILTAHLAPAPHDLSLRDPGDGPALAAETGGMLLPSGTLRLPGRPRISSLPGYEAGAWWVQDTAAALPVHLLAPQRGERVLDLCAAPGGKTMQLAAAGAQTTALEINPRRMGRLAENLARTRLTATTVTADALDWAPETPFDAILLDAPCSATGTIRRHPDLPHRFDPATLDDLCTLQARLLHRAFGWLRPGGRLVYATCSLLRAEGEAQMDAFLADHPDASRLPLDPEDAALPPGGVDAEGALRTLPSMIAEIGGLDGFYAAVVQKRG